MPAPPAKETPISHYTYKFRVKDGGGGTYITDKATVEETEEELRLRFGVDLEKVWRE
jgi:hypothetical protein